MLIKEKRMQYQKLLLLIKKYINFRLRNMFFMSYKCEFAETYA